MAVTHIPVLLQEVITGLRPTRGQNFIDGTLGAGGHAAALLKATAPSGKLLAFDRDASVWPEAQKNLAELKSRVTFVNDSLASLEKYVDKYKFGPVTGVLFDLGFSSLQLASETRGFSFQTKGELDLRYDTSQSLTAADILNTYPEQELAKIFYEYGEEKKSRALAGTIVKHRRLVPFKTVDDLLNIVYLVKGSNRRSLHPATTIWQALRIAVNDEFNEIKQGLAGALKVLVPGGRLAVISFHSGEDRIVKNFFRQESRNCICPPQLPVCRCTHRATLKVITSKPIVAKLAEVKNNPRAASAKLRLAEKI